MNEEHKANYYAMIPAYIRYNNQLKFAERLMYGEITALSNKEGYCFASNRYFANLYGVSQSTISRWISHLAELNSIKVEVIRNEKKEIIERRIYLTDTPYVQNCVYSYMQKNQQPIRKMSKDNIININMLDSLYNYIINKEKKIPKEFQGYENQILEILNKYEMIYPIELLNRMSEDNIEKVKVISYALALTVKDNVDYLLYKMSREKILSLYIECKNREKENENTENQIMSFTNYFYKSLKGQLLNSKGPYFFEPKIEENEEGEEM